MLLRPAQKADTQDGECMVYSRSDIMRKQVGSDGGIGRLEAVAVRVASFETEERATQSSTARRASCDSRPTYSAQSRLHCLTDIRALTV